MAEMLAALFAGQMVEIVEMMVALTAVHLVE